MSITSENACSRRLAITNTGDSFNVRFSNRPVGVKRFQTAYCSGVDVTHGLVASLRNRHIGRSIMGFEDEAERSFGRPCHRAGPSGHPNSPHPSSREGHQSTACSSSFLLLLISLGAHALTSLVHLNSVPSTQMRCMITAKRRASATIARFMPRRLAICIAQALSHDHRLERTSMLWAAS